MTRTDHPLTDQVRRYYDARLMQHGATPRGVDWNSAESQQMRFGELARVLDDPHASVLDYGCGYGALATYLRARGHRGRYTGYDISQQMIDAATAAVVDAESTFHAQRAMLAPADYVLASGIFNVKQNASGPEWRDYVLATIDDMFALAVRGLAFNMLTSYSDPERQRSDLFYANPMDIFDYCKRRLARAVSLLHESPLYEFTVVVRR